MRTSRATRSTWWRTQLVAWVYESLSPSLVAPDNGVERGDVERAFDQAAARDPAAVAMPPSWTTIRLVPHQLDFWQAGTELIPPDRTRFLPEAAGGWRCFPVLP